MKSNTGNAVHMRVTMLVLRILRLAQLKTQVRLTSGSSYETTKQK